MTVLCVNDAAAGVLSGARYSIRMLAYSKRQGLLVGASFGTAATIMNCVNFQVGTTIEGHKHPLVRAPLLS